MQHECASLHSQSGSVFYQSWLPSEEPAAIVLLIHGLAEHSSRYADFAAYLVAQGVAVFALDLPGHGQSYGDKAFVHSFDEHFVAIELLRLTAREKFPGYKPFLFGHSMGGLLATAAILKKQTDFSGCFLSGAALQSSKQPSAIQLLLVKLIAYLFPKFGVLQLDANEVSRDSAVVKAYINDPLVYGGKVNARCVVEMFSTMQWVTARQAAISCPLLVLHGAADAMTAVAGSQRLYQAACSTDKQLKIYSDLFHEILNEPQRQQVYNDIAQWLRKYL